MAASWGNSWGASWNISWGRTAAIVQPVLPIHTPGFRSIDAKSIADVYNRGLPEMPDYEWPNRRKFYQ